MHLLWGPLASGAAGNTQYWTCFTCEGRFHEEFSDKQLKQIKGFSDFTKKVDWKNFDSVVARDRVSVSVATLSTLPSGMIDGCWST